MYSYFEIILQECNSSGQFKHLYHWSYLIGFIPFDTTDWRNKKKRAGNQPPFSQDLDANGLLHCETYLHGNVYIFHFE